MPLTVEEVSRMHTFLAEVTSVILMVLVLHNFMVFIGFILM